MRRREFLENVLSGSAILFGSAVLFSQLIEKAPSPVPQIRPNGTPPGVKKNHLLDDAVSQAQREILEKQTPLDLQQISLDQQQILKVQQQILFDQNQLPLDQQQAINSSDINQLALTEPSQRLQEVQKEIIDNTGNTNIANISTIKQPISSQSHELANLETTNTATQANINNSTINSTVNNTVNDNVNAQTNQAVHAQHTHDHKTLDLAKVDPKAISPDNTEIFTPQSIEQLSHDDLTHYLEKIRNFEDVYASDVFITEDKIPTMISTMARMERVQSYVGHGHYNLLGFEDMLRFSRKSSRIGSFTKAELDFLEEIFFFNAQSYGFYGEKLIPKLTAKTVNKKRVHKVPRSGHYLLKGRSVDIYKQITSDIGNTILLTSGVRNVVKQMHLFLAKAISSNGNFSKASRSLAPPGHSYHAVGDFDVGKIGYGKRNFTAAFAHTKEYRKLQKLLYVKIRYTTDNRYGVRFEPWHIKVV